MRLIAATLIIFSVGGCASMRSTSLTRQDNDAYVQYEKPTLGVPVTVRVPTHLQLAVLETLYYEDKSSNDSVVDLQLFDDFQGRRNLKVRSTLMRTEKVITVDLKRPAAGSLEYNLNFDLDSQYITQIESFLYDRTLSDSANLLATLVPGAEQRDPAASTVKPGFDLDVKDNTNPNSGTAFVNSTFNGSRPDPNTELPYIPQGLQNNLMTKERVVAIAVFDINACDFEQQVAGFLVTHVNNCHTCSIDASH